MTVAATLDLGGLALPAEAVTQTFVLGKRGSGKTTTARVLIEELLGHGLPAVVLRTRPGCGGGCGRRTTEPATASQW